MNRDDLVRDVYAHFGLAFYRAQVLEHGLANAMMYAAKVEGRLPTVEDFDAFLEQKFHRTLGGLINDLRKHISVEPTLEALLQSALLKRNWLAHHYFRERSEILMTDPGCRSMILELEAAQELFGQADEALERAVNHLAAQMGVTRDTLDAYVDQVVRRLEAGG